MSGGVFCFVPFLDLISEESEEPHHWTIPIGAAVNSTDSGDEFFFNQPQTKVFIYILKA